MPKIFKYGLLLVLGLLYTGVLIYVIHRPTLKVLAQWKKPDSVHYGGASDSLPLYLDVVEGGIEWGGFPLNLERRHFIYVGFDPGKPAYGHMIDFTFYPDQSHYNDLAGYLKNASVDWGDEGVVVSLPSAHRLFIPKSLFLNGR